MTRPPTQPLFLARQTYRWRRATDAARLLPVLGGALFLFPLLRGGGGTAGYAAFVFLVWFGLILCAAFLSKRLTDPSNKPDAPPAAEDGRDP